MSDDDESSPAAESQQIDLDRVPDVSDLQVLIDGTPKAFTEYTRDFTNRHYPNADQETIMVPAISFHQTWTRTIEKEIQKEGQTFVDKDTQKKLKELLESDEMAKKEAKAKAGAGAKAEAKAGPKAKPVFEGVTLSDCGEHREDTKRASLAEYVVTRAFQRLSEILGAPSAIIVNYELDNYLKKVRKNLKNVPLPEKSGGEHDVLFIRADCGILVVSVKSVGGNFGSTSTGSGNFDEDAALSTAFGKVMKGLPGEVRVVEHVLSDLSVPVKGALALPNISKDQLHAFLERKSELRQELSKVLSNENILTSEFFPSVDQLHSQSDGDNTWIKSLKAWFHQLYPKTEKPALTLEQYKDVFGRYCGLFSTVTFHTRSGERRFEVRSMAAAISETSRRFQAFVLLPFQINLLCSNKKFVYMYGMMGSGKTVMLCLKARLWLNSGANVILLNVGYDSYGQPIGHGLLDSIKQSSPRPEQIKKIDVRLRDLDNRKLLEQIQGAVAQMRSTDPSSSSVNFILDEVYPKFMDDFEVIMEKFPRSEIWTAGLEEHSAPEKFDRTLMKKVLRCPPRVQRIIKPYDQYCKTPDLYTTCGADEGLPSEGPMPKFIFHHNHSSPSADSSDLPSTYQFMASYSPLNCKECAEELCEIFGDVLEISPQTTTYEPTSKKRKKIQKFTQDDAARPALKDIALLCKEPEGKNIYPKRKDGTYRFQEDLFPEFMDTLDRSLFVNTLRDAGYKVRIVRNAHKEELITSVDNAVTAAWVYTASGIEWTVVIYMPGDPSESPSLPQSEGQTREDRELEMGEEAIRKHMSERDKKYLFWAGSRCTAQLIVIVP